MSGRKSEMNGLVVKHPVYGSGVVMGEDKYGRLIIKLAGGHQVNSINKSAVKTLSEDEVFKTDVFNGLSKSGMIAYVRTPYSEKKGLTEGESGPWACKKCGETFDPDLPQINFDRGEKGFYGRKDLICPNCGSNDVKYLGGQDDKADMYGSGTDYSPSMYQGIIKDYAYRSEDIEREPDLPAVRILESVANDMVLDEDSIGYGLAKLGSEGIRSLVKQGVLKRADLFALPRFIKEGKELWGKAVDIVWDSGKILESTGKPNYGAVVNVWKSLYKKECGDYPKTDNKGKLTEYFQKQGEKMSGLIQKMSKTSVRGVKVESNKRDKVRSFGGLRALASEIEGIRDSIFENDSDDAVDKIDDILEKIESKKFGVMSEGRSRFSRKVYRQ